MSVEKAYRNGVDYRTDSDCSSLVYNFNIYDLKGNVFREIEDCQILHLFDKSAHLHRKLKLQLSEAPMQSSQLKIHFNHKLVQCSSNEQIS